MMCSFEFFKCKMPYDHNIPFVVSYKARGEKKSWAIGWESHITR